MCPNLTIKGTRGGRKIEYIGINEKGLDNEDLH